MGSDAVAYRSGHPADGVADQRPAQVAGADCRAAYGAGRGAGEGRGGRAVSDERDERQPCGAVGCCREESWKFTPAAAPRKHDLEPEIAVTLDASGMARYAEVCAAIDRRTAFHEAAHCVVAACY